MAAASGCLIALALGATAVEGAVGADAEVAAGRAPVGISGPERNSIQLIGTPAVGLRLYSPTQSLTASYSPRFYYRVPNDLDLERPLLLHQAGLAHQVELGSTSDWRSGVRFSAGELDYTTLSLVFDPQSANPPQDVAEVMRLDGDTTWRTSLSSRTGLALTLQGEYTRPLDEEPPLGIDPVTGMPLPPDPGSALLESAAGTIIPQLRYQLSRRDVLTTSLRVSYQWFSNDARYLLFSPQVGWERRLSARTNLITSAGPLYVVTLEAAPGVADDNTLGGAGVLELNTVFDRSRGTDVTGRIAATLEWFFDPLAGTSDPRAGLEAGIVARFGRDWTFTPNASLSTLLDDSTGGDLVRTDASVLRAELPWRYRITDHLAFNFGLRGSLRGRGLNDSFNLSEQHEIWAYMGLSVAIATSGEAAPWLGPAVFDVPVRGGGAAQDQTTVPGAGSAAPVPGATPDPGAPPTSGPGGAVQPTPGAGAAPAAPSPAPAPAGDAAPAGGAVAPAP